MVLTDSLLLNICFHFIIICDASMNMTLIISLDKFSEIELLGKKCYML